MPQKHLRFYLFDFNLNELEKDLNAAKPGTATKEKSFKFVLKDNNWLPEDSFEYGKEIGNMVSNQ